MGSPLYGLNLLIGETKEGKDVFQEFHKFVVRGLWLGLLGVSENPVDSGNLPKDRVKESEPYPAEVPTPLLSKGAVA